MFLKESRLRLFSTQLLLLLLVVGDYYLVLQFDIKCLARPIKHIVALSSEISIRRLSRVG